jgi:hypothetical protein
MKKVANNVMSYSWCTLRLSVLEWRIRLCRPYPLIFFPAIFAFFFFIAQNVHLYNNKQLLAFKLFCH